MPRCSSACASAARARSARSLMLGDPDLAASAALLDALVAGGADMVEVGIPFSDPVADGPVIQAAATRALEAGVRVADCFVLIAAFRERHPDVPLGILTYANLVMARGRGDFFRRAAQGRRATACSSPICPRSRPSHGPKRCARHGLDPVLIAASNTPPPRSNGLPAFPSGYTYCVTRAGITGTHAEAQFDCELIARLRDAGAAPPMFGFGISTPGHVRAALAAGAAGVICGSAIVVCAAAGGDVRALVATLKAATRNDSARH